MKFTRKLFKISAMLLSFLIVFAEIGTKAPYLTYYVRADEDDNTAFL